MGGASRTDVYERIGDLPRGAWRGEHLFASAPYLRAIEDSDAAALRYALLRRGDQVLAGAVFTRFDLGGLAAGGGGAGGLRLARALLAGSQLRMLVCGNVFCAGPHGYWRTPDLSDRALAAWLHEAGQSCGDSRSVLAIKDLPQSADAMAAELRQRGFLELDFDPAMVLSFDPRWRSLSDYAAALTSPYRRELVRARERSANLVRRELEARDIARLADDIDDLYAQVVARARVAPVRKSARAFARLRELLGQRFSLVAYFAKGALVAFNTRFFAGADLESHYFGMDYERSQELSLYRNILYDDLDDALRGGFGRLCLGRSSHEIKSALGAQPVVLRNFGRHPSRLTTALTWALTRQLAPPVWQQRHPFRRAAAPSPPP